MDGLVFWVKYGKINDKTKYKKDMEGLFFLFFVYLFFCMVKL